MSSWKPKGPLGKSCQICGRSLAAGALKYILKLEIWADFDGQLPEEDDPEQIPRLLQQVEEEDADVLESQVHHSQFFLICPECRKNILKNPLAGDSLERTSIFSVH